MQKESLKRGAVVSFLLTLLMASAVFAKSGSLRDNFYKALSSSNLELINKVIAETKGTNSSLNKAFEGGLMMRKADLVKVPAEKLRLFKAGARLLEAEIASHPDNTEYRFIRLIVQENAPKVVRYRENIESDKEVIIRNFGSMSAELKKHVSDYAKNSKILSSHDLN